jgi:transposase
MTMPTDDHMSKSGAGVARRIEVFTGAGRRRVWSAELKASIVAESYAGRGSVCDVARRHGLTPTQLFSWRRAARGRLESPVDRDLDFVPALIDAPTSESREEQPPSDAAPLIGFEMEGASVWVCPGADTGMVATIIRALKEPK